MKDKINGMQVKKPYNNLFGTVLVRKQLSYIEESSGWECAAQSLMHCTIPRGRPKIENAFVNNRKTMLLSWSFQNESSSPGQKNSSRFLGDQRMGSTNVLAGQQSKMS